jgi:hypothetical protein
MVFSTSWLNFKRCSLLPHPQLRLGIDVRYEIRNYETKPRSDLFSRTFAQRGQSERKFARLRLQTLRGWDSSNWIRSSAALLRAHHGDGIIA